MVPVVPGPGVAPPGQNRDNAATGGRLAGLLRWVGLLLTGGLAVAAVSASPTGPPPAAESPDPSGGPDPCQTAVETAAEKLARTNAEIDRLVADHHAATPRDGAAAIGAVYARYSTRHQDSVPDQVRATLADATAKRVHVPREHVFFDLGVRGYKSNRDGLNRLRECLAAKRARVLIVFATSRLFRKAYKALQFVEEEVIDRGLRAVFVMTGVDTANAKQWRGLMGLHGTFDESLIETQGEFVRAKHLGLLDEERVYGAVAYGYAGEPVPGAVSRTGKPKKRIVVDPATAAWVRRAFAWFVADKESVIDIARRLNAGRAPVPARMAEWSAAAVRKLLANPRYRGEWRYGDTARRWVSGKDYARQDPRPAPLGVKQIDRLRLVSDADWHAARARLAVLARRASGRRGPASPLTALVTRLFRCPAHDRPLTLIGGGGELLMCPSCVRLPAADRPLYSGIDRAVAVRATGDALAARLRADPGLVGRVVEACRAAAERLAAADPAAEAGLSAELARLDARIQFVLRNPGDTPADEAAAAAALRQLRRERAEAAARLAAVRAQAAAPPAVPTAAEVAALIDRLAGVLTTDPAAGGSPGLARAVIDRLTSGAIVVEQAGERRPRRGWLRGRFRCPLTAAVAAEAGGPAAPAAADGDEVVVDYKPPRRGKYPHLAGPVRALYDAGLTIGAIARRVGVRADLATRLLDASFAAAGQRRPDGRTRTATLSAEHRPPARSRELAEAVKKLSDDGHHFVDIGRMLGAPKQMVFRAWRYWHWSRGLAVPDGRALRRRPPVDRPPAGDPSTPA